MYCVSYNSFVSEFLRFDTQMLPWKSHDEPFVAGIDYLYE